MVRATLRMSLIIETIGKYNLLYVYIYILFMVTSAKCEVAIIWIWSSTSRNRLHPTTANKSLGKWWWTLIGALFLGKPTYQWTNSTIVSLLNTSTIPFIQYFLFGCFGVPFHSPKLPRFTLGSRIVLFLFSVLFFLVIREAKHGEAEKQRTTKAEKQGKAEKQTS